MAAVLDPGPRQLRIQIIAAVEVHCPRIRAVRERFAAFDILGPDGLISSHIIL
jgi:hypothetical protein